MKGRTYSPFRSMAAPLYRTRQWLLFPQQTFQTGDFREYPGLPGRFDFAGLYERTYRGRVPVASRPSPRKL